CNLVTSITVNASNTHYKTVGGVLFNYDQTTLILYPRGNTATTYTIPGSVTSIEAYAFNNCTYLTSITINSNILIIGEYAFSGCTNLTITVNLKLSQKPIGWSSSWNTNFLATIWLPE
ncbi:MAG: leucine-rich repeat domain-containing protein, partial [Acholeplasmatales bacterium]|nr:leucine-rich repeat domain-containing protein [Acholeplasmatales bacterium]